MVRPFYGTSAVVLFILLNPTEAAFLKKLGAALAPKPRTQEQKGGQHKKKDGDNRRTVLKTEFGEDEATITMAFNYDGSKGEEGHEEQSLTDITYLKRLSNDESYEYNVYTGSSIAKQDEEHGKSSGSLQDVYTKLNQKTNPLGKKIPTCTATHMIHVPEFNKQGKEGKLICWEMALELEASAPQAGFSLTKLSTTFGKKYNPGIEFNFDMTRLRQMVKGSKTIKLPEKDASERELKRLCERQLAEYATYLGEKKNDDGKNIQNIVMWLTTGDAASTPRGLAFESKKTHHEVAVAARTGKKNKERQTADSVQE